MGARAEGRLSKEGESAWARVWEGAEGSKREGGGLWRGAGPGLGGLRSWRSWESLGSEAVGQGKV